MSRFIADLLQTDYVTLHHLIQEYERQTGQPSHDARLISDIQSRSKASVRQLGLDPKTTTASEAYFAAKVLAKNHNDMLSRTIGVTLEASPEEMVKKCIAWLEQTRCAPSVWSIKHSTIKAVLKKKPPKQLMRLLGLKSVDSMLKRNNACELYAVAKKLEKIEWRNANHNSFNKVTVSDFDTALFECIVPDAKRCQKFDNSSQFIMPCYEAGVVVVVPPAKRFELDVLALIATLANVFYDAQRYSAYFRAISVRPDFANQVGKVIHHGIAQASAGLLGRNWNSLYRNLVGNEAVRYVADHPHLDAKDFGTPVVRKVLAEELKALSFWDDTEYVFYVDRDQNATSLHLLDVITNAANKRSYEDQYSRYARSRLEEELHTRYLSHPAVIQGTIETFLYPEDL